MGCGKGPNQIDPAFQSLYDKFIKDANSRGLNLDEIQGVTIQFADTSTIPPGGVVGQCSNASWGSSTVTIDAKYWAGCSDVAKKVLLYHELGHCVLSEGHTSDPDDIMYADIGQNLSYFSANENKSLDTLFSDAGDY